MKAEQNVDLQQASLYLKQLAAKVKRPVQRAFLLGLLRTLAIILQLACIAAIAQGILTDGETLIAQSELLIGLIAASALRVYLPYWQQQTLQQATMQATQFARAKLLKRWQREQLSGQQLSAEDGALLLEPIEALKGYFSRYLVQQYLVVFSPLLVLLTCFYINPVVGLLLLVSGPVIPAFMALVGIGAERLSQQHAEQTHALSQVFTDKLRNLTSIQLFAAGDAARNDVAIAGERYRKATMSTLKVAFLSSAVLEFFASVAIAAVALYVGFGLLGYIDWLAADQLTLFSGLLVLLLAPEYFAPLRQFAQSYHDRAAAVGAAALLCESHRQGSQVQSKTPIDNAGFAMRWQNLRVQLAANVHLNYPDTCLNRAELTVISGPSGSGKTTLLRILLGQSGFQGLMEVNERLFPGCRLDNQQIAYFAQQPFLTAQSLRANVNLFQHNTDAEIVAVCKRLKLDVMLAELNQGLDTRLGEQGRGLSGGERRRLALARCMLADRPVVIADEPTENLDPVSAAAICNNLLQLAQQGRTVIVASHDPGLMAVADQHVELS
ncbi:MAG: ABC transporter ATP-binding protein/permease [Pseudomonadota bacterium]